MNSNRNVTPRRNPTLLFRFVAVMLLVALGWNGLGQAGLATAAATVTSIKLDELTAEQKTVYVNETSLSLMVWAYSSDGTSNATNDASWVSSNAAVQVNKGVVSATGEATNVVITAKYQGFSQSVTLNAKYRYDELKLKRHGQSTDAPATLEVQIGESHSLDAIGIENGNDVDLTAKATWTSSNTAAVSVAAGVLTLNAAGKATITVKYLGRSDTIDLTVTSPYKSVAIQNTAGKSGPFENQVGEPDISLKAIALESNGQYKNISSIATWKSANPAIATVDEAGVVKAIGPGTTSITVSYLGVTDTQTIAVTTPFEALQLTPNTAQTIAMQEAPLQVTAKTVNGSVVDTALVGAVWESTDLTIISVNGSGGSATVTPRGKGTAKVKITFKGLTKELSVTVLPTVSEITVSKDKLDVYVDDTADLPAVKGTTLDGNSIDISKAVKWTSSDEAVISIGTDGKWTALKTGKATLTASISNGSVSTVTDTVEVTVNKKVLALLADQDNLSLVIGKEMDIPKVQVVYEDGDEADVSSLVTWKASSANLLVKGTKIKGLLASKVTLTGTYLNKTVKVNVVVEEEFTSFTIEPSALALTLNKSQTVKVTGTTKSGKKVSLGSRMEWNATSDKLVTIKGSTIRSLSLEGNDKLTATIQGKKLELPVSVKAKLTKLEVSDNSLELAVGGSSSIAVTATYENGNKSDVTAYTVWTASSTKVARVSGGSISAVGKGTVSIKAAYGGKTVNIRVKVK